MIAMSFGKMLLEEAQTSSWLQSSPDSCTSYRLFWKTSIVFSRRMASIRDLEIDSLSSPSNDSDWEGVMVIIQKVG